MSADPRLAVYGDVEDIWRPLTADQQERATKLIAKASALLRWACPFDVDARIALSASEPDNPQALDSAIVATVVAGIVKRVMVNPDGAASSSETAGPFSKTANFVGQHDSAGGQDRSGLTVTAADIDALRAPAGFGVPYTIRTRPQQHSCWPR